MTVKKIALHIQRGLWKKPKILVRLNFWTKKNIFVWISIICAFYRCTVLKLVRISTDSCNFSTGKRLCNKLRLKMLQKNNFSTYDCTKIYLIFNKYLFLKRCIIKNIYIYLHYSNLHFLPCNFALKFFIEDKGRRGGARFFEWITNNE